jgi:AmiR/NasT family two-component response regulator
MKKNRPFGTIKALIEDENPFHRRALHGLLHAAGIRTIIDCEDTDNAYARFLTNTPDIIFINWNDDSAPPPANIARFTAHAELSRVRPEIIVLADSSSRHFVEQVRTRNVDGLIIRPYTAGGVLRYLERSHQRVQERKVSNEKAMSERTSRFHNLTVPKFHYLRDATDAGFRK